MLAYKEAPNKSHPLQNNVGVSSFGVFFGLKQKLLPSVPKISVCKRFIESESLFFYMPKAKCTTLCIYHHGVVGNTDCQSLGEIKSLVFFLDLGACPWLHVQLRLPLSLMQHANLLKLPVL